MEHPTRRWRNKVFKYFFQLSCETLGAIGLVGGFSHKVGWWAVGLVGNVLCMLVCVESKLNSLGGVNMQICFHFDL